MSDNVCPTCKNDGEALKEALRDCHAEMSGLRAELAEMKDNRDYWRRLEQHIEEYADKMQDERDEARQLARYFYHSYIERDSYFP